MTVIIRWLSLYYKSTIRYIFCNKSFKAFLEGQMSKEEPTFFASNKKPTLLMWQPVIFFTHSHLFLHSISFSTNLTTSH